MTKKEIAGYVFGSLSVIGGAVLVIASIAVPPLLAAGMPAGSAIIVAGLGTLGISGHTHRRRRHRERVSESEANTPTAENVPRETFKEPEPQRPISPPEPLTRTDEISPRSFFKEESTVVLFSMRHSPKKTGLAEALNEPSSEPGPYSPERFFP